MNYQDFLKGNLEILIRFSSLLFFFFLMVQCQNPVSKPKNSLRLNFTEGDLPSLVPSDLQGHIRGRTVGKLLYEGLITRTPEGKIELAGAEKIDISSDGKEYEFTLRTHYWSDGTPVTAFDYQETWKSLLSSACSFSHLLYPIKNAQLVKEGKVPLEKIGIQAINSKKLKVILENPSPYFLDMLSHPIFAPLKTTNTGELCFNGPFVVKKWERNRYLNLKQNPHFWNRNKIHLNSIDISFVHDFATAFLMYEKNEIDWAGNPFCRLTLEDMKFLKNKGILYQNTTNRTLWIYLNTEKVPFSSPYIRKALSGAIDRVSLIQHIFLGDHALTTPLPTQLTLCPPLITYNREEAQKNFALGLKELGISKEEFPQLEICYQDSHKNLCLLLQETWENTFGISVVLKALEWNVLKSNLERGDFLLACSTESSLFPDPIELLERFASLNKNNTCRWTDSRYQELLSLAKQSDGDFRQQCLKQAEEILIEEMPLIPIANRNHAYSHSRNLKNILIDSSGYVDFRWAYWSLD